MAAYIVRTADTGAAYIHAADMATLHDQTAIRIQFNRTRGQPQHYGCADDAGNYLLQRLFTARERLDAAIVSAIISMAHSMGLNVIVEGVETEQQLNVLLDLQCNEIQGFLFSPPVPQEEATALLDQNMESRLHTATARQTTSG